MNTKVVVEIKQGATRLEELFYLVEVSQFDFSEEETSCGNERNARKKLD